MQVIRDRAGGWTLLAIIIVGLWVGITLLPTLWHGYTLLAVPSFVGRAATVICLGGGLGLLPLLGRISDPLGRRATRTGGVVVARR
jgi:MFS family permease